jgi:glutathione S-transferase
MFARVPSFEPAPKTKEDIERVFEIWTDCLDRSAGGPYLFGEYFGIADAIYYPVVTRFRTYGIELPTEKLKAYVEAIEATPVVMKLVEMARREPGIPTYDDYIRGLGGDPNKELS